MRKSGEYYYAIDVVRFLASFMVALFHLGWSTWNSSHSLAAPLVHGVYRLPEMEDLAWWGAVGVQVFFVISGFVIPGSANGATPMSFVRSRVERLYPSLWLCAPITAAIWLFSGLMPMGDLMNRLVRSMILSPMGPWIDGPYWTLACEVFFYFLIFCLLAHGSFRRLELFAKGLTAYSVAFNLLYFAEALGVRGLGWVHLFAEGTLKPLLPYYGVFFALGIFLWLDRRHLLGLGGKVVAFCALVTGAVQVAEWATKTLGHSWIIPTAVWLLCCVVIRYARWTPGPKTASFVRALGLTTYPLYLVHFTLGVWMIRTLVQAGLRPLSALVISMFLVVLLAYILANYLEPVIKRALRRVMAAADVALEKTWRSSLLYRRGTQLELPAVPCAPAVGVPMGLETAP